MSHALLSPSGASRWLACTPSARLEQQFPESTSSFAEEGTLAHKLGEYLIKQKLGRVSYSDMDNWEKQSEYYSESMLEYCDEYATFVVEQYNTALATTPDAQIFLEQRLDITDYVPEGFGTGDVVIISDGTLTLIDLKYGKGVPVYAENNKQMMLYALGALKEFDFLYDISTVSLTIYQPRIDNTSTWEISVYELLFWAEVELKPRAELAFAGEGEYVPGNHCQFCKAKAVCKALADKNLEIARYDFADPALLSDEEIADILNRYNLFVNWINAVEEYALNEAVKGKIWPGYKLVEGRSNRKYTDENKVAELLLSKHFPEDGIFKKTLKGITAMEHYLGKKPFDAFLGSLIIKPPGKATLVPASDKRREINNLESAKADFADI